jgi:hypothetical protein
MGWIVLFGRGVGVFTSPRVIACGPDVIPFTGPSLGMIIYGGAVVLKAYLILSLLLENKSGGYLDF